MSQCFYSYNKGKRKVNGKEGKRVEEGWKERVQSLSSSESGSSGLYGSPAVGGRYIEQVVTS